MLTNVYLKISAIKRLLVLILMGLTVVPVTLDISVMDSIVLTLTNVQLMSILVMKMLIVQIQSDLLIVCVTKVSAVMVNHAQT